MRPIHAAAGLLLAAGLAIARYAPPGRVARAAPAPDAGRQGVELTIYTEDFGLVHETRPAQLGAGANRLGLAQVSREMDPHSVLLRCQAGGGAGAPEIVGHSYDLGLTSSQGLLKQKVGEDVELVRYGDQGEEASREQGRLLVAQDGCPAVVQIGGKLYVNPKGTLVVAADEGNSLVPQLAVQVQSPAAQPASVELTYLTRGLRWSADYVATLSPTADTRMDLECYATVTNRTGVRYPDARVVLVAGAPNRAARPARARAFSITGYDTLTFAARARRAAEPQALTPPPADWEQAAPPESVAELHTYPLKSPATIQNEQLNRLLMLRRAGVQVKKDYSYRAPGLGPYESPVEERGAVAVALSFVNDERRGVGAPLPQGAIRVYKPDRSGRLRYAGAAGVPPTPANRKVSVTLANAFDLTGEYRTLKSTRLGKHRIRKDVQVVVRNERAQAAAVRVVQPFHSQWRVSRESLPHARLDGSTAQWTVPVPAGGRKTLTFTVELSC